MNQEINVTLWLMLAVLIFAGTSVLVQTTSGHPIGFWLLAIANGFLIASVFKLKQTN